MPKTAVATPEPPNRGNNPAHDTPAHDKAGAPVPPDRASHGNRRMPWERSASQSAEAFHHPNSYAAHPERINDYHVAVHFNDGSHNFYPASNVRPSSEGGQRGINITRGNSTEFHPDSSVHEVWYGKRPDAPQDHQRSEMMWRNERTKNNQLGRD